MTKIADVRDRMMILIPPFTSLPKRKRRSAMARKSKTNWVDISREWNRSEYKSGYTYIDLFSGAGGISLGFDLAGFKGLAAVENMPQAVATYKHNFDHPVIDGDIRAEETKKTLYEIVKANGEKVVDVVCGGFPCQGFSMSGYRRVDDSRNFLYKEMLEIVRKLKPGFVMMENVVGLRSMLGGKVEEKIINDYETLNYRVNVTVLDAADYYVPQHRKRVIFICNRLGKINHHPKPLVSQWKYLTTRDAIEDLLTEPENPTFNHVFTKHRPQMQSRLKSVKEGESLYANYSDAWKKCPWNEPSCTIKENHGGVNIHPILPRVLTAREMARIQSFPDDFVFKGSKKWQLVQIGNAVPPLLAKAIALAIQKSMEFGDERINRIRQERKGV